jgi:NAD(P)-dependent dehydrogenase (short-subunit alcohol dehydrogenase family)
MTGPDLTGRTALVTGASRGIGLATAQALAAAGASVVLTSRKQEAAEEAAAQVNDAASGAAAGVKGVAVGVGAHATDEEAARHCVDFTVERFGSLDILINNAGTNPAFGPLTEMDHGRFAKTFDVNLWAPVLWTSLAVKAWMGEHGGAIVNTSSVGGIAAAPGMGVYNASKAALIHLTRHLALELAPGIRVNAVAPAVVRTRLAEMLWRDHEEELNGSYPLGRIGEPGDVASAVLFLASDTASWITGETLVVDGGALLGQVIPR